MMELSDEQFDQLISRAMDELPQSYITGLQNVAIVMADEPSDEQKVKLKLRNDSLLLGLYEGVPLIKRSGNEAGILPDKITLFKHSIMRVSHDEASFYEQIKRTLWHEIAHYYGLDHDRIDHLQQRSNR